MNDLQDALLKLSHCLYMHYQQKVIILIDEYDVPLQSAYTNGYYDEMVDFLRNVFSSALKTNDALEKGVLTGCLRISKESIFTGLNNFNVYSIMDEQSSTRFGFTQQEVNELLNEYNFLEQKDEVKEWYDGYRSVSYTHLDVYKRQEKAFGKAASIKRLIQIKPAAIIPIHF